MNPETEALIRRYKSNINLSGRFYIFFGLWSVIRVILMLTMDRTFKNAAYDGVEIPEGSEWIYSITLVLVFAFIFMVIMGFHLFIGINAIRYSKGKSKNIIFLILAGIDLIVIAVMIPHNMNTTYNSIATIIASTAVDMTVIFLLFDMIYSAIKVNNLTKAAKE